MRDDYQKSDFIILGRVIEIYDSKYEKISDIKNAELDTDYPEKKGYWVKFEIIKDFKNSESVKSIIVVPNWDNCDFLFKKNKEFVIFGSKTNSGEYKTSICKNTFAYTDVSKKSMLYEIIEQ